MKNFFLIILFFFSLIPIISVSQNATLRGVILDDSNKPISNVNIRAGEIGTETNENGFFLLKIASNTEVSGRVFSPIS